MKNYIYPAALNVTPRAPLQAFTRYSVTSWEWSLSHNCHTPACQSTNVKEHKRLHSTPWEWDQAGHTSYKFLLFCFHMGFFSFRPTSVFKTDPSTLWSRRWCLLDSDRWCLLPSWQHERNAAKRAQVSKWSLSCPAGWWDAIVAAVMELQERPCPGCTARKAQMESEMEWGGKGWTRVGAERPIYTMALMEFTFFRPSNQWSSLIIHTVLGGNHNRHKWWFCLIITVLSFE